jgi:predicted RNase H-like HicB family nuclease
VSDRCPVLIFLTQATDGSYVYIAVAQDLEGCFAQGDTPDEARENLDAFRADYIAHLSEHGRAIPGVAGWDAVRRPVDEWPHVSRIEIVSV